MNTTALFAEQELAEAAFDLLTSTSVDRYVRMAKQAAQRSKLSDRLRVEPTIIPEMLQHAKGLWRTLRGSTQRDVPEVELAILLALLAETGLRDIDSLLVDLSLVDSPTVAWIGALARRLLHARPRNAILPIAQHANRSAQVTMVNSAHVETKDFSPPSLNTTNWSEEKTQHDIVLTAA